jgi:hypothetical protein
MKGYHEVKMSIWHALMVGMTCIVTFKTHPSNGAWFDFFKHEPKAMVIDEWRTTQCLAHILK